ncbi:MAG: minor capsid protein [Deltaproteobacteria bacterium]|nr:minor capsid protein [Deltaproteobacteria bacterium]
MEALAHIHNHGTAGSMSFNSVLRQDPTRTTQLRAQFVADVNRRFRTLQKLIRLVVGERDCFGLGNMRALALDPQEAARLVQTRAFAFGTSREKVERFMSWLQEQEKLGILEVITRPGTRPGVEEAWTDKYIQTAYQKGIIRARKELEKAGYTVGPAEVEGLPGRISGAFLQPVHADKVGMLFSRTFSELKGITAAMDQSISRILATGIAEGRNPMELARDLNAQVKKIGINRARTMARTEVIRAHHVATVQEYRLAGLEGVQVRAEWATAGYDVCPICEALEGKVFSLDEIEGMIPAHPNCRCVALPLTRHTPREKEGQAKAPVPAWKKDPVAKMMQKDSHAREYYGYKRQYKKELKKLKEEWAAQGKHPSNLPYQFKEFVLKDEDLVKCFKMVEDWQRSTHHDVPMAFKLRAERIEKDVGETLFRFASESSKEALMERLDDLMPETAYLKFRALNQAYMEMIGLKRATLYRGTDGRTGERIREALLGARRRTRWKMKDNSLAGYTSREQMAREFGSGMDGVDIRRVFPRKDIVVHKDFVSGLTRGYVDEEEWIVKGVSNKYVSLKDMRFLRGDGTKKRFGEIL